MSLVVGNRVRLKKDHNYYDGDINPTDILGTITWDIPVNSAFIYKVLWDNGCNNTYREGDLYKIVKDTKIARLVYKGKVGKEEDGWLWLNSK